MDWSLVPVDVGLSEEDFPEALWAPAWAAEPGHTPLTPFESSVPATLHHALQHQTPSVPNIGPLPTRPFCSIPSPLIAILVCISLLGNDVENLFSCAICYLYIFSEMSHFFF